MLDTLSQLVSGQSCSLYTVCAPIPSRSCSRTHSLWKQTLDCSLRDNQAQFVVLKILVHFNSESTHQLQVTSGDGLQGEEAVNEVDCQEQGFGHQLQAQPKAQPSWRLLSMFDIDRYVCVCACMFGHVAFQH